jgi:DNA-binding transcriptional ArsR family regulator
MSDFSTQLLERIADRLKAIADPMRLRILHTLQAGEHNVNDILGLVGSSQANVSKHLAVLKKAGLVDCRREGTSIFYFISDPEVFDICRICCDGLERQINADRAAIEQGRAEMMSGHT